MHHWKTTYGLPHATDKTVVSCHQLVALTTHKNLFSEVVEKDSRWLPVARHELSMGQMMAYAVIVRRCEADRDVAPPEPEPVG